MRSASRLGQLIIVREKILCELEDAIGHERCRKNIYRIVDVSKEHRYTKDRRQGEIKISPKPLIPKNERQKERQGGVRGKEISCLQVESNIDAIEEIIARNDLVGIDPEMRRGNEKCADRDEYRDGLQREQNIFRLDEDQSDRKKDGEESSFDDDDIHIYHRQIIEEHVTDELGRVPR